MSLAEGMAFLRPIGRFPHSYHMLAAIDGKGGAGLGDELAVLALDVAIGSQALHARARSARSTAPADGFGQNPRANLKSFESLSAPSGLSPTISLFVVAARLPISVKPAQTVFSGHGGTNMGHREKLKLSKPPSIRIEIIEHEAINAIA